MVTSSPELKGLRLDEFTKSARQLRKLTDELQDVSMSLRMVPVSATFQKMHRIVRDMCKKLNKQAKATLVGEETEIDKTIVDSISDPIMHIVRNSMDHGIEEDVQDRIRAGKNPVGEITLSARQTGSEVIIEIRDDGQGINDEAVLRKAVKSGLASPDVEYSHREILNFLDVSRLFHQYRGDRVFRPGRRHGCRQAECRGGGRDRSLSPASWAKA